MKPVFMVSGMLVAAVLLFVATVVAANRALSDDDTAADALCRPTVHSSLPPTGPDVSRPRARSAPPAYTSPLVHVPPEGDRLPCPTSSHPSRSAN